MIGGGVGLIGAMGALKRSDLLKRAALTHKVKRGTMINTVVGRVRDRSGQFGSFGKLPFFGENFLEFFSIILKQKKYKNNFESQ